MPRAVASRAAASVRGRPACALASGHRRWSLSWSLHVGDELLGIRTWHDGNQFPAVVAPVVEYLLGRVHEQRYRRVLPLLHGRYLSRTAACTLAGRQPGAAVRATTRDQ